MTACYLSSVLVFVSLDYCVFVCHVRSFCLQHFHWLVYLHIQYITQTHFRSSQRDSETDGVVEKYPYVGPLLVDRKTGELLGRQVAKRGKKLEVKRLDQSTAEFVAKKCQRMESTTVLFEVSLLEGDISFTMMHDTMASSQPLPIP